MAYINEFAKYSALNSLLKDEDVQDFMENIEIHKEKQGNFQKIDNHIVDYPNKNIFCDNNLDYVFAFDGSKISVPINNGLPGATVSCVRAGYVCVDMVKYHEYEKAEFPHPLKYREIFSTENINIILPGTNVSSKDGEEVVGFFRRTWYEAFKRTKNQSLLRFIEDNNISHKPITLLETLKSLLMMADTFQVSLPLVCKKPITAANFASSQQIRSESSPAVLEFEDIIEHEGVQIYITDLLGLFSFSSTFNKANSISEIHSQAMNLLEKFMCLNLIENLIEILPKEDFKRICFILDGPLALYGAEPWIAKAISNKIIKYINEGFDLLIVGIEKTGLFVEHLQHMDKTNDLNGGAELRIGMLFYLNQEYIKKYIKQPYVTQSYRADSYFGKKLFYKNNKGALFVVNHNFISEDDKIESNNSRNSKEYLQRQTRLNNIIWILERFQSSKFKNAITFIALANESVSLSNSRISKKIMGGFAPVGNFNL